MLAEPVAVAVDNGAEMTTTISLLSTKMLEATTNLASNMAQSEVVLNFRTAQAKLQTDEEAQSLLTELSEIQQKIRSQQFSGSFSETDIERLRTLQNSFGSNESIQNYQSRNELEVNFLREVNQEISQVLGIDFAALARRTGGSC